RSCQAGPLATRESHLSERQRSAIRDRSRMRCGIARWLRWPLIARPAWPPPTMSVSIFSTDMVGVASPGLSADAGVTALLFIGRAELRKILFYRARDRIFRCSPSPMFATGSRPALHIAEERLCRTVFPTSTCWFAFDVVGLAVI